jgi:hypothetical protein
MAKLKLSGLLGAGGKPPNSNATPGQCNPTGYRERSARPISQEEQEEGLETCPVIQNSIPESEAAVTGETGRAVFWSRSYSILVAKMKMAGDPAVAIPNSETRNFSDSGLGKLSA